MSYVPGLRASLPWDQPLRYLASGHVRASERDEHLHRKEIIRISE